MVAAAPGLLCAEREREEEGGAALVSHAMAGQQADRRTGRRVCFAIRRLGGEREPADWQRGSLLRGRGRGERDDVCFDGRVCSVLGGPSQEAVQCRTGQGRVGQGRAGQHRRDREGALFSHAVEWRWARWRLLCGSMLCWLRLVAMRMGRGGGRGRAAVGWAMGDGRWALSGVSDCCAVLLCSRPSPSPSSRRRLGRRR